MQGEKDASLVAYVMERFNMDKQDGKDSLCSGDASHGEDTTMRV